jgi:hypothetical protein
MMSDCQGDRIEFWLSWVIVILCFLAYECTCVFFKKNYECAGVGWIKVVDGSKEGQVRNSNRWTMGGENRTQRLGLRNQVAGGGTKYG